METRVLFIQPPYDHVWMNWLIPPLGLLSVAAVLEENGFSVEVIDGFASKLSLKQLRDTVSSKEFDVVGISSLTATYRMALETAKIVKEIRPSALVILGGPHPSVLPHDVLASEHVDLVVIGEGERTCLDLIQAIDGRRDLATVKGIGYKRGSEAVVNPPREPIENLDLLPQPARHLVDMRLYEQFTNQDRNLPTHHLIVSRGCPYQCVYCSKLFGGRYRMRSPEKVIKEIRSIVEEYGARGILFIDDLLTMDKGWLHRICDMMIAENMGLKWRCNATVSTVDKPLLEKMKKAGCYCIFYGVESGSEDILRLIKKNITKDLVRKAFKITRDAGMEIHANFIFGLPGETAMTAAETLRFAKELRPDSARFSLCTPFPGTELAANASIYGTLCGDMDDYDQNTVTFVPTGMTKKQLLALQRKAYYEYYLNPPYILRKMTQVRRWSELMRLLESLKAMVTTVPPLR